jgi:prepilin-type N-terminal cleavage/methylation domain-containing protein
MGAAMTERGFSLVELLIATAIMTTTAGVLLSLVMAGQSIARLQPEAADLQQRARIATQLLATELVRAGAGLDAGPWAGSLSDRFPPITPSPDGGVTIWYVGGSIAQGLLAAPLQPDDGGAAISIDPACAAASCGFADAATVLLFDATGCHDFARVEAAAGSTLTLRPATRTCAYAARAAIAQGEVRTYRVDAAARQLVRRDEATGLSVPLIDSVTAMTVEFLAAGRQIRIALRLAPTLLLQVPDLAVTFEARPPNLQAL